MDGCLRVCVTHAHLTSSSPSSFFPSVPKQRVGPLLFTSLRETLLGTWFDSWSLQPPLCYGESRRASLFGAPCVSPLGGERGRVWCLGGARGIVCIARCHVCVASTCVRLAWDGKHANEVRVREDRARERDAGLL